MIVISHQREKCIGCNYCVEIAEMRWCMSKKDGKSILLGAKGKKGFYSIRLGDEEFEENKKAAEACPVDIIKVSQI